MRQVFEYLFPRSYDLIYVLIRKWTLFTLYLHYTGWRETNTPLESPCLARD
jgi:hypothetical protein